MRRALLATCLFLLACSDEPSDATPAGAAQLFVDALELARHDPDAREQVYELLASDARRELVDRARSTTALGAREIAPWEMLVESRSILRFRPAHAAAFRPHEGPEPGTATVTVMGEHDGERTDLHLRREDEGWRIVIEIPPPRASSDPAPDEAAETEAAEATP